MSRTTIVVNMSGCLSPALCFSAFRATRRSRDTRPGSVQTVVSVSGNEVAAARGIVNEVTGSATTEISATVAVPAPCLLGRKSGIDQASGADVGNFVEDERKQSELETILSLRRSPTSYENDPVSRLQIDGLITNHTAVLEDVEERPDKYMESQQEENPSETVEANDTAYCDADHALKVHATILCGSEVANADVCDADHTLKEHATILCGSEVANADAPLTSPRSNSNVGAAEGNGGGSSPMPPAARDKRFDFGVGVAFCHSCSSKLPHLNRGCQSCSQRMCRNCFSQHTCMLASAHEMPGELARSTPNILA